MNTTKLRALAAAVAATNALALPILAQAQSKPAKPAKPAAPAAPRAAVTGTAAEVNGEKIPAQEVERKLERIKAAQPVLQADTPEARKALDDLRGNILETAIEWRLQVQEAKKLQMTATPKAVDDAVAEFRKNFKTEAEMKAQLTTQGVTVQSLRGLITEGLLVNQLESRWMSEAKVTEEEVGNFYRDNVRDFALPESVRARHILVSFGKPEPTADDKAKARAKAADLLAKARAANADFGVLAGANSDDPGSKANGGDLGQFRRGMMIKPFEDAAFGAKAGEIVGPIETVFGFHVIKVEQKVAGRTATLTEVRDDLRNFLLAQKREASLKTKMENLKKNANIRRLI